MHLRIFAFSLFLKKDFLLREGGTEVKGRREGGIHTYTHTYMDT